MGTNKPSTGENNVQFYIFSTKTVANLQNIKEELHAKPKLNISPGHVHVFGY